jgi:hypothetical protein
MSSSVHTEWEVRRLGSEYGHELAAALLLASSRGNADRVLTREMARIVLRELDAAVRKLRNASFPADLTALYERAARAGVRDELLKSRAVAAGLERHAA